MKTFAKEILLALLLGFVLPMLWLWSLVQVQRLPEPEQPAAEQVQRQYRQPIALRSGEGGIVAMDCEEYLVGVILAEMPADFEPEAIKAQSVAARTYVRKALQTGGKHLDGSVCSDYSCCQAYISPEEYLIRAGIPEDVDKVRSAVDATYGQVLCYNGELIEATYFSGSGGWTEEAAEVWGVDYPYLQAKESPWEQPMEMRTDFSAEELSALLGVSLSGPPGQWVAEVVNTQGGGIRTAVIGGQVFSGVQLRQALRLRSTRMTFIPGNNSITVVTTGYGHRVGLSQYGADAMAAAGKDYREILQYYYEGAQLLTLPEE